MISYHSVVKVYFLFLFFEEMMQKATSDQKEKPHKYGHRELYTVYTSKCSSSKHDAVFQRTDCQQVDVPVDLFSWSISCRVNAPL